MKLSIITVCLNSEKTIEKTIESVVSQGCPELEYIIVDGGSTDRTLDIIKRELAAGHVEKYVSEKDKGIADAFNKGILLSSGEVIGIINSDDQYLPGVLRKVAELYEATSLDFILYGNMIRKRQGETKRIRPRPFPNIWKYVDCPFDHPTLFVPKRIYDRVGLFNTGYRYAMDYDFYARALDLGVEFRCLNEDIALFSGEGKSGQRPRECHREVLRSQLENGLFKPLCYLTFALKMGVNRLKSLF